MPRLSILARLQQFIVAGLVLAATGWLAWQWPRSPWLAMLGACAILFVHAGFLAAEFLLLRTVGRDDAVPVPSSRELLRAWWCETRIAVAIFGWRQPFRWRDVPDQLQGPGVAGRRGIVFIHGFVCNRGFWRPWLERVRADGRAFVAVNLEPVFTSIDDYGPIVERAVAAVTQATGRPPVLVCHSMGGLVARAWLRHRPAQAPGVAHVVTIGSPHRGTWLARLSQVANGRQMRLDSPWVAELGRAEAARDRVPFTCWYSHCDNIVFPPTTATLSGADNRLVHGAGHVDLAFVPRVMEESLLIARE
ncbi:esterase/lipase family protein [Ramlibacter tataouinensis]|uniref:Lipase-like protein n=1 Tax=Ramlibacter tataouinensis (strain ATCC BAA-407 / DSM 14655 / LMG 21543 / TTB310) TaxID=365046 RepID=F5XW52_RAMTT|nr:alpha/beta fold hydrolase [Ramlibacter tataouinensis]AEG91622.1 lipase-like protein [Ramlibacter tataouinensis TTB310]